MMFMLWLYGGAVDLRCRQYICTNTGHWAGHQRLAVYGLDFYIQFPKIPYSDSSFVLRFKNGRNTFSDKSDSWLLAISMLDDPIIYLLVVQEVN